ncbi:MAG: P-loop NTPase fold protein [bacterium]
MADEQGGEDRELLWFERDAPARVAEDGPDPLGQRLAWRTLKAALAGYEPPACVALYGPWGSGKTTLLRSAFEAFEGPKVWFDPWQYAQTGDVRMALLGAIAQGLGLEEGSKGWETVKSIGKAVGSFAFRAGLGFVFGRQLLPELENSAAAGFKAEDAAAYFPGKAVVDAVQSVKTGFKALVDAALEGKGPTARVLVCLDDLDRCLPADVVALIEAVKLLLVGEAGAGRCSRSRWTARSWARPSGSSTRVRRATPVKTIWKRCSTCRWRCRRC